MIPITLLYYLLYFTPHPRTPPPPTPPPHHNPPTPPRSLPPKTPIPHPQTLIHPTPRLPRPRRPRRNNQRHEMLSPVPRVHLQTPRKIPPPLQRLSSRIHILDLDRARQLRRPLFIELHERRRFAGEAHAHVVVGREAGGYECYVLCAERVQRAAVGVVRGGGLGG